MIKLHFVFQGMPGPILKHSTLDLDTEMYHAYYFKSYLLLEIGRNLTNS